MLKARVLYAKEFTGQFDYLAEWTVVAEFQVPSSVLDDEMNTLKFLEQIYRAFNVVDGTEIVYALERRSMSMGDMVEFTWTEDGLGRPVDGIESWSVDMVGFGKRMAPGCGWTP